MERERSSVYTVMQPEIDRMFPDQIYNENSEKRKTSGLRKGLVALSIATGIFGNISGCNSYLASQVQHLVPQRQEVVYESKNDNLPSRNIPIDIDGAVNGLAVAGITYSLGRILLSIKEK